MSSTTDPSRPERLAAWCRSSWTSPRAKPRSGTSKRSTRTSDGSPSWESSSRASGRRRATWCNSSLGRDLVGALGASFVYAARVRLRDGNGQGPRLGPCERREPVPRRALRTGPSRAPNPEVTRDLQRRNSWSWRMSRSTGGVDRRGELLRSTESSARPSKNAAASGFQAMASSFASWTRGVTGKCRCRSAFVEVLGETQRPKS